MMHIAPVPGASGQRRGVVGPLRPTCTRILDTYMRAECKESCARCFVVDGAGMWEALLVGAIPVTASSPMDSLLRRLPVLIVDDWDEITLVLLQDTFREFEGLRVQGGGVLGTPPRATTARVQEEPGQVPGRHEHAELFADFWSAAFRLHAAPLQVS